MEIDDRIKELNEHLQSGIAEISNSDNYKKYLKSVSLFHSYSARNTLLIFSQNKSATHVASFDNWRKLNRHVMRAEHGISIFAPVKTTTLKAERTEENGQLIPKEKEVIRLKFRAVSVFDISQTEGEPLPELLTNLATSLEDYEMIFNAAKAAADCTITFKKLDVNGCYIPKENAIYLDFGLSDAQTIHTLFHELAHSVLHKSSKSDLKTKEVQAESVAFILSEHFGLDTAQYSFPSIADWANDMTPAEIQSGLQTIQRAAHLLITDIADSLEKIRQWEQTKQVEKPSLVDRLSSAKVIALQNSNPKEESKSEQHFNFKRG